MVTRDVVETLFSDLRQNTDWDLSLPMVWGYFFTAGDFAPVEPAIEKLLAQGYEFMGVFEGDKAHPDDAAVFWIHVQKIEHHTVDSLCERNDLLAQFAASEGLDDYDGMDVGPVDPA